MAIDDFLTTERHKVQFNDRTKTTSQQNLINDSSTESSMEETSNDHPITTAAKDIKHRFPESETTDFRISCGLTVFHTHKAKLTDVPCFVRFMARGPGKGNSDTVDLSDFHPAVIEVVLLHAYGAKYVPTVAKQCNRPSSTNVVEVRTDGRKDDGIMKMTISEYYTPIIEMQRWKLTRNYHKAGIGMHKMRHPVDRQVSIHFCKELYMHAGVYVVADGLVWKELAQRAEKGITDLLPHCWASENVLGTYTLLLRHMTPAQRINDDQPLLLHLMHKLT